ncbi:MAG: 7-cyano-7-deazaguanine synthase, partial [Pseudomonadota bacterium]
MPEQLFLCGLSSHQRSEYDGGCELKLNGPDKNIRLEIDDIRKRFLTIEPPYLTDLLEIASYVFAADCAVRRGGITFPRMGQDWRREFRMVIAVSEPSIWEEPSLTNALCEVLEFLSDDTWRFEFVPSEEPVSLQDYLTPSTAPFDAVEEEASIILFSGGLDSFAGTVHELNTTNRKAVLVSRKIFSGIDKRQRELANELKKLFPKRVFHVPVDAGLTIKSRAVEHTQRTRTFLLSAIAHVAATIEASSRILFFENGIMSINLPISGQVVGTRASRSTHPRSLLLMQNLLRRLGEQNVEIKNPFIWRTKTETLEALKSEYERNLIRRTVSCSRTRNFSIETPHCGTCAQCLQRRISTLAAGLSTHDPGLGYEVDFFEGAREKSDDRKMAIDTIRSAFEYRKLSEEGFACGFVDEITSVAGGFPDKTKSSIARNFVDMFRRYSNEVREIFLNAAREKVEAVVDRTLPTHSLLEFVIRSEGFLHDEEAETLTTETPALIADEEEPPLKTAEASTPIDEFRISLDDQRNLVRIEGIGSIKNATEVILMKLLIKQREEDLKQKLAPENYGARTAKDLADAMKPVDEVGIRKAISRIRKSITEGYEML